MAQRCQVCGEWYGAHVGPCACFVGGVTIHPRWLDAAWWARLAQEAEK
jgi:hypothetical protein